MTGQPNLIRNLYLGVAWQTNSIDVHTNNI